MRNANCLGVPMTSFVDGVRGKGRREVLKLTGALAALSFVSGGSARAAVQGDDDFFAVSRLLVGKEDLSATFSDALLAAFRRIDPSFDTLLARLRQALGDGPLGSEVKTRLAGANSDLTSLPQVILSGWYLGVVGSGEKAICVAYVDALANRAVADVLRPQSYSYGAYGSWAKKPA